MSDKMVMAELKEVILERNFLSNCMYSIFNRTFTNNISHTGLFFINPNDALEYKNYIQGNYQNSSRDSNMYISINSLKYYYKLISSSYSFDFRLIPDLKEISDFLYRYKSYRHISINKNQIYGKNYFKGQPIYIIQPVYARHKSTNLVKKINYNYFNSSNSNYYPAIFLNYENSILAWRNFKDQNNDYDLPLSPPISVYNLEDFIYYYAQQKKILIVPGLQTYASVKNYIINKSSLTLPQKIVNQAMFTKKIVERILWSLTSRQPLK